ncbi:MAG: response regulator transcription factor [Solirubrobacteraceae bacterium]|nr:response regulator transcription factor [Solirubrobacteraceae bacterium]
MRVVVGEDELLLRAGLVRLLEDEGMEVAGVAGDGPEVVRKARAHRPDLVIADIRMPPTNTDDGLRAALEIRAGLPGTAVLVLSQYVHERYALELLGDDPAGVGYLLEQRVADLDRFFESLRRVCAGGTAVDPEVVSSMLGPRRDDPLARLTDRQREVLALMAEGRSNAGIARQLVVTEKAVAKHITRIFDLLELDPAADDHRRVLAVVRYLSASAPT